jgi:hypothetical protein
MTISDEMREGLQNGGSTLHRGQDNHQTASSALVLRWAFALLTKIM